MIESYSQCGQDIFVLDVIKSPGYFLDLGCYLPDNINNTYLLEKNGWDGVSLDIDNYEEEWTKKRNTKFINYDCFSLEYPKFLGENFPNCNSVIDYLSLDMEKAGDRYLLLKMVMDSGYEFKVITIEHDSHLGNEYEEKEKNPQRSLLNSLGYKLVCSDISNHKDPEMFYEDWWINPKYVSEEKINRWNFSKTSCDSIFSSLGINYKINEISKDWENYKK